MSYPVYYVPSGDVVPVFFSTYAGSTGASITLTGLAVTDIEIYKDGGVTQRASDAGYTLLDTDGIDFDTITGIHGFSIDTGDNTDAGFYTVGAWFHVVVSAVTVDTQTVNFIACAFRLMPAESVAGKPKVDVDAFGGTAGTFAAGRPEVNTSHIAGSAVSTSAAQIGVNVVNAGGTAWGSGAITAASIAADAITAAKVADGAIDAGAIAADAITAAKIADGAIDRATFAADTGLQTIRSNTAQAGAAGTITLDASASATTDFYVGAWIFLTGGTGAGQARVCTAYNGTTKVATIAPNWATNPDATSTFAVLPAGHVTGVQGNVTGSVASVTGAVGSVTGNVGGNVAGSVGSVTGAVGSVTGNVGGNVAGSVGSVTGNVGGNVAGSVASVTARVTANVDQLNGDATAAANLAKSASVIYQGTVTGATPTTTTLVDSGLTQSGTDHWKGRIVIFTSGSLKYQATDITAFTPASDTLTFTALTAAPAQNDTYVIV